MMRGNQTIIKNSLQKVLNEADDFYMCNSDKLIISEDYEMGEKPDMMKYIIVSWLDRMINSENCYSKCKDELMRLLNKIISV